MAVSTIKKPPISFLSLAQDVTFIGTANVIVMRLNLNAEKTSFIQFYGDNSSKRFVLAYKPADGPERELFGVTGD